MNLPKDFPRSGYYSPKNAGADVDEGMDGSGCMFPTPSPSAYPRSGNYRGNDGNTNQGHKGGLPGLVPRFSSDGAKRIKGK